MSQDSLREILNVLGSRFDKNNLFKTIFATPNDVIFLVVREWKRPHRYYHTIENHLLKMLARIDSKHMSSGLKERYEIAALFHDVIYDPRNSQFNEEKSIEFFMKFIRTEMMRDNDVLLICDIIKATKSLKSSDPFIQDFLELDQYELWHGPMEDLLANELLIFKEYQLFGFQKYIQGRIKFIDSLFDLHRPDEDYKSVRSLKVYVQNRRPMIAIYPGSFSPFHIGHMNIIQQAEAIFDQVVVACGINTSKIKTNQEGVITAAYQARVSDIIPFHHVIHYSGLLSDIVKQYETFSDVTVVRGLRNGFDLEYEINQLRYLQDMHPGVKVVYFMCHRSCDYVSSSDLRALASISGTEVKDLREPYLVSDYNYAHEHPYNRKE
jgi:pantetheine-phosphate adenylyltransferase